MDEKITVSAEFTQTDVAAALMCLGEELTPEIWAQIKAAPSKIDFNKIEDKSERMPLNYSSLRFPDSRDLYEQKAICGSMPPAQEVTIQRPR